jgi:hypothetical protein
VKQQSIDPNGKAAIRMLIGEACQFDRGREGKYPLFHIELACDESLDERHDDVLECVLRLEVERERGKNQRESGQNENEPTPSRGTIAEVTACHIECPVL